MNYNYHFIHNFPEGYPLWKKVRANLLFLIGVTKISFGKNELSPADVNRAKVKIEPGDIVLLGSLKRLGHFFIRGPLTHSLIYMGKGKGIHAHADGIEEIAMNEVYKEYDTMVILRLNKPERKKWFKPIKQVLNDQLGKPYDFEWLMPTHHPKAFYCTELLDWAFAQVDVDLKLFPVDHPGVLKPIIHPMDFLKCDFKRIFMSHNLNF